MRKIELYRPKKIVRYTHSTARNSEIHALCFTLCVAYTSEPVEGLPSPHQALLRRQVEYGLQTPRMDTADGVYPGGLRKSR